MSASTTAGKDAGKCIFLSPCETEEGAQRGRSIEYVKLSSRIVSAALWLLSFCAVAMRLGHRLHQGNETSAWNVWYEGKLN